jgi:hypothetical protein
VTLREGFGFLLWLLLHPHQLILAPAQLFLPPRQLTSGQHQLIVAPSQLMSSAAVPSGSQAVDPVVLGQLSVRLVTFAGKFTGTGGAVCKGATPSVEQQRQKILTTFFFNV